MMTRYLSQKQGLGRSPRLTEVELYLSLSRALCHARMLCAAARHVKIKAQSIHLANSLSIRQAAALLLHFVWTL